MAKKDQQQLDLYDVDALRELLHTSAECITSMAFDMLWITHAMHIIVNSLELHADFDFGEDFTNELLDLKHKADISQYRYRQLSARLEAAGI